VSVHKSDSGGVRSIYAVWCALYCVLKRSYALSPPRECYVLSRCLVCIQSLIFLLLLLADPSDAVVQDTHTRCGGHAQ
jgi:hypothetical protein